MADPVRKLPVHEEADPFRYGWRWQHVRLPNGEVTEQPIPLTPEGLLDPQLGDEVTRSGPHARIVTLLHDLLDRRFEPDPDVLVLFDMKIVWGIPGLPNPSPDLAVVRGIRDKEKDRSIFKVAEEGVKPSLIIEVVSYSDTEIYRNDHERKVELYQRAGIPEYLVVDPSFSPQDRLVLTGYRLAPDGRYRRIASDSQGRLCSETTGLLFAPSEDGRTVRVGEAGTGDWLLTAREEEAARKTAEVEIARLRAELERFKKTAE